MSAERLSMRKVREVLRLQSLGLSARQIARSLNIGRTAVTDYLRRAQAAGLAWPLPEDLDDQALQRRLFVERSELGGDQAGEDQAFPRIHLPDAVTG